jgi:hypothetical protein
MTAMWIKRPPPSRHPAESVLRSGAAVVHLVEQFAVPSRLFAVIIAAVIVWIYVLVIVWIYLLIIVLTVVPIIRIVQAGMPHSGVRGSSS